MGTPIGIGLDLRTRSLRVRQRRSPRHPVPGRRLVHRHPCPEAGNDSSVVYFPSSWMAGPPCDFVEVCQEEQRIRHHSTRSSNLCRPCSVLISSFLFARKCDNLRATHHASSSKHCIVDRVRGNVTVLTLESDINHS